MKSMSFQQASCSIIVRGINTITVKTGDIILPYMEIKSSELWGMLCEILSEQNLYWVSIFN